MKASDWLFAQGPAVVRAVRRLGLVGLIGLGMLAFTGWAAWSWRPAQVARTAELGSEARRLRHELMAAADSSVAASAPRAVSTADEAWGLLWSRLPAQDQRLALQGKVLQRARAHGLQPSSVQAQGERLAWADRGAETLWRQRLSLPVQGRHADVLAWVQDLLTEPALSIDSLSLQRDAITQDQVQAQVMVSLWWRQGSGGAR